MEKFRTWIVTEGYALSFLGIVVFASFSPLFFGSVFFDEEQIGFYYPQSFFYYEQLTSGGSLYWNGSYYGGVSTALDQFVSSFYPLHWFLFNFLSPFIAHHASILIGVLGGVFFSYWFGRAVGFFRSSSILLALTYLLATTFGWLDIGTTAAQAFWSLPVLLLALYKIRQGERKFLFFILGTLGLAVGFLAGFIQIVFYECVLAFVFAVFLDWNYYHEKSTAEKNRTLLDRFRATIFFILIVLIALILSVRQIIPSVLFVNETIRSTSYAIQNAATPALTNLITFFLPDYIHIPFLGSGSPGFYVGPLALLTVIIGVIFTRNSLSRFFLAFYIVVLGIAFHIFPFSWLNEHIPPFSHLGGQFRWMLIGAFPLAYMAAHGYEALLRSVDVREKIKKRIHFFWYAISIILFFLIFVSGVLYFLISRPELQEKILSTIMSGKSLAFPYEHYREIFKGALQDLAGLFSLQNWKFLFPILFFPLSLFFIHQYLRGIVTRRTFVRLSILLGGAIVVLNFSAQFSTNLVSLDLYLRTPQIVKEIRVRESDMKSFRIAGFLVGDSLFWNILSKKSFSPEEIASLHRELLVNNSNVFFGIDRIDGMEPYRTIRHNQLLNTIIFPLGLSLFDREAVEKSQSTLTTLRNDEALHTVSLSEKVKNFETMLPLLGMMNVKYIYSLIPLSGKNLTPIPLSKNPFLPVSLYLYENSTVLPRAYFPESGELVKDSDSTKLLLSLIQVNNFQKKSFIECVECPLVSVKEATVVTKQYDHGRIELETTSDGGGWLVVSESFMPGWIAEIDGVEVPIHRANYLFQGVFVPKGTHSIQFTYHDITQLLWEKRSIQNK